MLSIKITVALILCALIFWLVSNLPTRTAELIFEIGTFIFGLFGFLFLLSVIGLFIFYKLKF